MIVPNLIRVLTAIRAHNAEEYISDTEFDFDEVRSEVLNYLISSDALTSFQVECPIGLIPLIEWLKKKYEKVFVQEEEVILIEESE